MAPALVGAVDDGAETPRHRGKGSGQVGGWGVAETLSLRGSVGNNGDCDSGFPKSGLGGRTAAVTVR